MDDAESHSEQSDCDDSIAHSQSSMETSDEDDCSDDEDCFLMDDWALCDSGASRCQTSLSTAPSVSHSLGTGGSPRPGGLSSDEEGDSCPICLNGFRVQAVGIPESCQHAFCLDCLLEWAKNVNSCPVDRQPFKMISALSCFNGDVVRTISVPNRKQKEHPWDGDVEEEQETPCRACGRSDHEERMLLCDACDAGFHMECLVPPLNSVPVEEWFCPTCLPRAPSIGLVVPGPTRVIARTRQSERVRARVNRSRLSISQQSFMELFSPDPQLIQDLMAATVAGLNRRAPPRNVSGRPKRGRRAGGPREQRAPTPARRRHKGELMKRVRRMVGRAPCGSTGAPSSPTAAVEATRPLQRFSGSRRSDIGAPSFMLFEDPDQFDPFESVESHAEESTVDSKRRVLSRLAVHSHRPVARPIMAGATSEGSSRANPALATVPCRPCAPEHQPEPDLLGSILAGQAVLLMDSSKLLITRHGALQPRTPTEVTVSPSQPCGASWPSRAPLHGGHWPGARSCGTVGGNRDGGSGGGGSGVPPCPSSSSSSSTPTSQQGGLVGAVTAHSNVGGTASSGVPAANGGGECGRPRRSTAGPPPSPPPVIQAPRPGERGNGANEKRLGSARNKRPFKINRSFGVGEQGMEPDGSVGDAAPSRPEVAELPFARVSGGKAVTLGAVVSLPGTSSSFTSTQGRIPHLGRIEIKLTGNSRGWQEQLVRAAKCSPMRRPCPPSSSVPPAVPALSAQQAYDPSDPTDDEGANSEMGRTGARDTGNGDEDGVDGLVAFEDDAYDPFRPTDSNPSSPPSPSSPSPEDGNSDGTDDPPATPGAGLPSPRGSSDGEGLPDGEAQLIPPQGPSHEPSQDSSQEPSPSPSQGPSRGPSQGPSRGPTQDSTKPAQKGSINEWSDLQQERGEVGVSDGSQEWSFSSSGGDANSGSQWQPMADCSKEARVDADTVVILNEIWDKKSNIKAQNTTSIGSSDGEETNNTGICNAPEERDLSFTSESREEIAGEGQLGIENVVDGMHLEDKKGDNQRRQVLGMTSYTNQLCKRDLSMFIDNVSSEDCKPETAVSDLGTGDWESVHRAAVSVEVGVVISVGTQGRNDGDKMAEAVEMSEAGGLPVRVRSEVHVGTPRSDRAGEQAKTSKYAASAVGTKRSHSGKRKSSEEPSDDCGEDETPRAQWVSKEHHKCSPPASTGAEPLEMGEIVDPVDTRTGDVRAHAPAAARGTSGGSSGGASGLAQDEDLLSLHAGSEEDGFYAAEAGEGGGAGGKAQWGADARFARRKDRNYRHAAKQCMQSDELPREEKQNEQQQQQQQQQQRQRRRSNSRSRRKHRKQRRRSQESGEGGTASGSSCRSEHRHRHKHSRASRSSSARREHERDRERDRDKERERGRDRARERERTTRVKEHSRNEGSGDCVKDRQKKRREREKKHKTKSHDRRREKSIPRNRRYERSSSREQRREPLSPRERRRERSGSPELRRERSHSRERWRDPSSPHERPHERSGSHNADTSEEPSWCRSPKSPARTRPRERDRRKERVARSPLGVTPSAQPAALTDGSDGGGNLRVKPKEEKRYERQLFGRGSMDHLKITIFSEVRSASVSSHTSAGQKAEGERPQRQQSDLEKRVKAKRAKVAVESRCDGDGRSKADCKRSKRASAEGAEGGTRRKRSSKMAKVAAVAASPKRIFVEPETAVPTGELTRRENDNDQVDPLMKFEIKVQQPEQDSVRSWPEDEEEEEPQVTFKSVVSSTDSPACAEGLEYEDVCKNSNTFPDFVKTKEAPMQGSTTQQAQGLELEEQEEGELEAEVTEGPVEQESRAPCLQESLPSSPNEKQKFRDRVRIHRWHPVSEPNSSGVVSLEPQLLPSQLVTLDDGTLTDIESNAMSVDMAGETSPVCGDTSPGLEEALLCSRMTSPHHSAGCPGPGFPSPADAGLLPNFGMASSVLKAVSPGLGMTPFSHGLALPGLEVSLPGLEPASPACREASPDVEAPSPGPGEASPDLGESSPGLGVPSPGPGEASPDLGEASPVSGTAQFGGGVGEQWGSEMVAQRERPSLKRVTWDPQQQHEEEQRRDAARAVLSLLSNGGSAGSGDIPLLHSEDVASTPPFAALTPTNDMVSQPMFPGMLQAPPVNASAKPAAPALPAFAVGPFLAAAVSAWPQPSPPPPPPPFAEAAMGARTAPEMSAAVSAQLILQRLLPALSAVRSAAPQAPTPPPPPPPVLVEEEMASPDLVEMEEVPVTHRSQHNPERSKTDKYLKKLHMQERAVEEAKLAIKPYYQSKDITKDEYKEILRKAVHKICHSKSGEINPVKVGNLVRGYVDKYKMLRKKAKRREESSGEWMGNSCTPDGKPSCSKTGSNAH